MKRIVSAVLLAAVLLSGCGMEGHSYVHVTPHNGRTDGNTAGSAPAENYDQLRSALQSMVESGVESGILYTVKMEQEELEHDMEVASRIIQQNDAIGAYAVDSISYEVGTTGGKTAVAITVEYRRSKMEIQKILHLEDMVQVERAVTEALEVCRPGVVMFVKAYEHLDVSQLVQDIARANPQTVMEVPEVAEAVYGTGDSKVIELSFSYENSRETLRQMQAQVKPVFDSAVLYVSGEGSEIQKFSQLYAFLMERFDYTIETSITPTYSLLRHGVGDSRAFATVYAAMCARAGLNCMVVTGARNGDPWTWNIIQEGNRFYHVDLLDSSNLGMLQEMTDEAMSGYVWDYSAYPACTVQPVEETE